MHIETHYIKQLLQRLAIVYLLFAICRLVFYLYNSSAFGNISFGELAMTFVYALRFDTSSILYANILVVLLHLFPFSVRAKDWYQKMIQVVFFISNGLVLLLEVADIGYFPYAFRRMLRSDFEMGDDIQNLLPQFLLEFWWLVLFYVGLLFFANYLYRKTTTKTTTITGEPSFLKQFLLFFPAVGLVFIGLRGGVQTRPLMPIVASEYVSNAQFMPLVSNTTLGVIHSFQQRTISYENYFDEQECKAIYSLENSLEKRLVKDSFQKKNIVFLVCESMGREYVGYFNKEEESHTPFLDSMLGVGLNFVNMYANGLRSTQGIVAITGGIPALMLDPFMFSAYQNNRVIGLGNLLAEEGYTNAFFHGGEVGTMGFSQFMPIVGVQQYYGRTQYLSDNGYPLDKDYDGNWGIWDIPFYDYALQTITKYPEPFFATLFSINVHHPFNTEPWFEAKYPKMDKRLVAIKYADYNLRKFFEKASKTAWFKNTVFVITADHTGPHRSEKFIHREGCYRIPLLLYCPSDTSLRGVRQEVTQQIDIFPTVLGYLGYNKPYKTFGVNKLDTQNKQHFCYTFQEDIYQIIGGDYVLHFDGKKSIALYNRVTDIYLKDNILNQYPDVAKNLETHIKAVIQTHHRSLIDNKMD